MPELTAVTPMKINSARQLAVDILGRFQQGEKTLDDYLDQADARIRELERKDRALMHALVLGVLRWQGRLDWIIDQLANRPAKSIDPPVRTILRLGLFQLLHMDRIPVSAAVNTSVELTKWAKRPWASGFVNKVLRRAANDRQWMDTLDAIQDPVQSLAVQHAFPAWLVERWMRRWGIAETRRLCAALNEVPTISLRANTLKTSRDALIQALRQEADRVEPSPYTPEGVVVARLLRPLAQWQAFLDGWFQVQDESSQLVAHLLMPGPTHRVWDACAGLGTKTAHLAQLMDNRGFLMAGDLRVEKLRRLKIEFSRLGIRNARFCAADLNRDLPFKHAPLFDRILVDAPCSGLGVLQKNPDGKWRTTLESLTRHHHRQRHFLNRAAPFLQPGGILVYSVCSFEPEETHLVVEEFLHDHPQFDISPVATVQVQSPAARFASGPYMTILPQRHRLNGFFAAVLIKR
jgi:16S rRNA (cytosine967-C5)-methyltransferase